MTTAGPPVKGRATRQRAAVAAALDEVDEFRSAQELHDMLKHKGDAVGLTTVYRTLQNLADAGEVDVLRTSDGESVYRRCSSGEHHHHLVCRVCGKAVEVEDRPSRSGPTRSPPSTGTSTWRTPWRSSAPARTARPPRADTQGPHSRAEG